MPAEDPLSWVRGKPRFSLARAHLLDSLCGLRFRVSPTSFYQVNMPRRSACMRPQGPWRSPVADDTVLDLYCGTGTIGLTMAGDVRRLIGVEAVPSAIRGRPG